MAYEQSIHRYRDWYRKLLSLYPRAYRDRYAESMHQTFNDLCREHREKGLFAIALWMYIETSIGIIRENNQLIMQIPRPVKFIIATLCLLFVPIFAELFNVPGWDWSLSDYVIIAVLLTGLGAALAFATGHRSIKQRIIGVAAVLFILALYVHMAVGIVSWLPLGGS